MRGVVYTFCTLIARQVLERSIIGKYPGVILRQLAKSRAGKMLEGSNLGLKQHFPAIWKWRVKLSLVCQPYDEKGSVCMLYISLFLAHEKLRPNQIAQQHYSHTHFVTSRSKKLELEAVGFGYGLRVFEIKTEVS